MKTLLAVALVLAFSTQCFSAESYEEYRSHREYYTRSYDQPEAEWLRYLETVNFRVNNLRLLNEINNNLEFIRCQNEESGFCDVINGKIGNELKERSNEQLQ